MQSPPVGAWQTHGRGYEPEGEEGDQEARSLVIGALLVRKLALGAQGAAQDAARPRFTEGDRRRCAMNTHERNEYFRRYLREHNISCNCGGPQYGTAHAPDCAIERAWDLAMAIFDDEDEGGAR
jgi:hypothetical protein